MLSIVRRGGNVLAKSHVITNSSKLHRRSCFALYQGSSNRGMFDKSALNGVCFQSFSTDSGSKQEKGSPEEAEGKNEEPIEEAEQAAPEEEPKETPEQIIARLEAELKESKNDMLRAYAECENVRTIALRDVKNAKKYANQSFAKNLLDVADNLQRALDAVPQEVKEHPESDEHLMALFTGVEMTNKELQKVFHANGLVQFGEVGDEFNPHKHDAMFQMPSDTLPPNTVAQILKTGYMMKDRVLRPAQVGTVMAAPKAAPSSSE